MKKQEVAKKMGKEIRSKEKSTGWYDEALSARYIPKAYRNSSKSGKASLNSVGKNEGEKHYLGKGEQPVA